VSATEQRTHRCRCTHHLSGRYPGWQVWPACLPMPAAQWLIESACRRATTLAYRCGGSTPWPAGWSSAAMCFPF